VDQSQALFGIVKTEVELAIRDGLFEELITCPRDGFREVNGIVDRVFGAITDLIANLKELASLVSTGVSKIGDMFRREGDDVCVVDDWKTGLPEWPDCSAPLPACDSFICYIQFYRDCNSDGVSPIGPVNDNLLAAQKCIMGRDLEHIGREKYVVRVFTSLPDRPSTAFSKFPCALLAQ
jgi:hypothetical protein